MTPEEIVKLQADLKAGQEALAKAQSDKAASDKMAADAKAEAARLSEQVKSKDQEAVTNRIKAEYPELAEHIGDFIIVGDYESMKTKADKLRAIKGSPQSSNGNPATPKVGDKNDKGEVLDEKGNWLKVGAGSSSVDHSKTEGDKAAKQAYSDKVNKGDHLGVINALFDRHAHIVKKIFRVA